MDEIAKRLGYLESLLSEAACLAIAEDLDPWKELAYRWFFELYGMDRKTAYEQAMQFVLKLK